MDRDTVRRRNALAEEELQRRGVLKGKLPPIMRGILRLFPTLKVPHYGDRPIWTLIFGLLFGVPMGGIVALILSVDQDSRMALAWLVGIGGGAAFGLIIVGFMASVHQRLRLTDWEDLEKLASGVPQDAEDYESVEADFVSRMESIGRAGRHSR